MKLFQHEDSVMKNCPCCQTETLWQKIRYIEKFPKYLVLCMNMIEVVGWVPRKLHSLLQFDPEDIDLGDLMYRVNEGEKLDDTKMDEEQSESNAPQVDQEGLVQLLSMGFSENRCKRALLENGNNLDIALNSIFATMDDPSYDEPWEPGKPQQNTGNDANQGPSQEVENIVAQVWPMIECMGIDKKYIYAAAQQKKDPEV